MITSDSQSTTEESRTDAAHHLVPAADVELPSYESLLAENEVVKPRTIHIDGVLIFPSEPPANALYQLSRDLIAGTRISIERIDHVIYTPSNSIPRTRIKDRLLYTFSHQMFDDSSIEMIGKRKECFPSVFMVKTSSPMGETWTVTSSSSSSSSNSGPELKLLEYRRSRKWLTSNSNNVREWRDIDGRLIAVEESLAGSPGSSTRPADNTSLKIVESLEQRLVDLLVTAWCARIWNQNLKATGQIRTIRKGKKAYFKG